MTAAYKSIQLNLGIKRSLIRFQQTLELKTQKIALWWRYGFERLVQRLFLGDLLVKRGLFKNLAYPYYPKPLETFSTMLPKLAGNYEAELEPVFKKIFQKTFDSIINIGSDDGYYAVGLARRYPMAEIQALEISASALSFSLELARANRVNLNKFHGSTKVTSKIINRLIKRKTLIISDCEGCELELLNPALAPQLKTCEMLVEVHDAIIEGITKMLKTRFESTHKITKIYQKAPNINKLNFIDRMTNNEMRAAEISWLYFEPKI